MDHKKPIGSDVEVGDDPYIRVYKVGEPGGCYGVAGSETEHFALGHDVVDCSADSQFPSIDPNDPIDNIILHCWFTKCWENLGKGMARRSSC
jgi:hypothetical protein